MNQTSLCLHTHGHVLWQQRIMVALVPISPQAASRTSAARAIVAGRTRPRPGRQVIAVLAPVGAAARSRETRPSCGPMYRRRCRDGDAAHCTPLRGSAHRHRPVRRADRWASAHWSVPAGPRCLTGCGRGRTANRAVRGTSGTRCAAGAVRRARGVVATGGDEATRLVHWYVALEQVAALAISLGSQTCRWKGARV